MKKEESKFISLAEAAKLTNYSQDYISLLCRQGKLRAEKLGRNWVTTKEWVYSYVDNTSGKGETVIPVKVKEKENVPEAKAKNGKTKKTRQPFYGQEVLEGAFFCFACLIWSINIFLLVEYWQQGDFVYDTSKTSAFSSSNTSATNQPSSETSTAAAASSSGSEEMESDVAIPFEKETDPNVINQKTEEVKKKFSDDVDVEVYKKFAIVNYKNSPDNKILYMMDK